MPAGSVVPGDWSNLVYLKLGLQEKEKAQSIVLQTGASVLGIAQQRNKGQKVL